MRISSVETLPISLPLRAPIKMSHVTIEQSENVLVKITTDDGIVGWGEGVQAMDVTGENQGRIKAAIDQLGEGLLGEDPLHRTEIWLRLRSAVYGNSTAVGAVDIALHDIAGQAHGVPVCELLGGASRTAIPALTLLGSGHTEQDVATFEDRYLAGFRWFKLKLGIGRLEDEVRTITAMASAHDDAVIAGDTNGGWTEQESARFLESLAGSSVRFIEQPTMDVRALIRLAERSPVALCADESARSLDDLLVLGPTAVAGVSLKLIKHGGITGVMRGAALCDQVGLKINLAGKVAESAISAAANLQCASAVSNISFGCSPANQGLAVDVCREPPEVVDGFFTVPTGPGLGIEVDEDLVSSLASQAWSAAGAG